jgi:ketosteroid isomerase-like protein
MTANSGHQLARDFFAAVASGHLPEELVTPDMTAWTLSSGDSDRERFAGGIKMLAAIVSGELVYDVLSLTAEDDRVVAEVTSDWALVNGERARNRHVFIFQLRDGRIASVSEYMDPAVPREIIGPLIQQTLAARAKQ